MWRGLRVVVLSDTREDEVCRPRGKGVNCGEVVIVFKDEGRVNRTLSSSPLHTAFSSSNPDSIHTRPRVETVPNRTLKLFNELKGTSFTNRQKKVNVFTPIIVDETFWHHSCFTRYPILRIASRHGPYTVNRMLTTVSLVINTNKFSAGVKTALYHKWEREPFVTFLESVK